MTKTIELESNDLKNGENQIQIDIIVSWGRHLYTEPLELHGQTEIVKVNKL